MKPEGVLQCADPVHAAARTADRERDAGRYQRHRPEQTLLYRTVDEYFPEKALAALAGQALRQLTPGMACSRAVQEQLTGVLSFPFPLRFLFASRPAVSEKHLSLTSNGNVRYQLKTPYRESLPREPSE